MKYWLTFNEINIGTMPMGSTLSLGTIQGYTGTMADVKDDINERYNALHHQLLASARCRGDGGFCHTRRHLVSTLHRLPHGMVERSGVYEGEGPCESRD